MPIRRLVPPFLGLLVIGALVALRLADPYPVEVARNTAFDVLQRLAPRPAGDWPVRVVDIDEASLAEVGQWPWPRDVLATLTERLGELGAAAIGFDVLFPEPDRLSPSRRARTPLGWATAGASPLPDTDRLFAAALARTPSILGFSVTTGAGTRPPPVPRAGFAVSGTDPTPSVPEMAGAVLPLPVLAAAAPGLGGLSLDARDSAGVVRQVPLVWRAGGHFYPSLSLEALRIALGAETIVILGDTAGQGVVDGIRVGDITVPTDAAGNLTLYAARPDAALFVSARDLLGPGYRDLAPLVAGQIVLVGTSASGLIDLHGTPLGDNVPGVAIHAGAIQQMLAGSYLVRADWVSGLEIAGFVFAGLVIALLVLRVGPLAGLAVGTAMLGAVVAASWYLFRRHGVLADPSFALVGGFLTWAAMVFVRFVISDADRRQIRRAFGNYVSPALLAEIERTGARLRLGGEVRELTVMFADMRDFTTISEAMAPQALLGMLNTLFGALGREVMAHFGTIDKFIGDALMAFWNAPVDVEDHARRACAAALGMRGRLAALNAADAFGRRAAGTDPAGLAIGIGISTGPALVGNVGLETRFDYSCLGDTVNVASRVEGAAKALGYDIAAVEATRAAASDFAWLEAGALALKGKARREPIHILVGDPAAARTPAFAALGAAHAAAIAALRAGEGAREQISRCRMLAAAVEPGLARFYETMAGRGADFAG